MPENPKGMKGLAEILRYLLLLKAHCGEDYNGGGKGNKITNLLRTGIKTKLDEFREIKDLI
jgi:hypothetical protein